MHVVKVLSGWVGMCVFVQYVSIISLNITNVIIVFFYKCYITVWDMVSI